jgi:hypothetical protein
MIRYKFSQNKPASIEQIVLNEGTNDIQITSFFNVDIHPVDGGYEYIPVYVDTLILESFTQMDRDYKYGKIIEWILADQYKNGDVTAILANYLNEPDNEKYIKEFKELQAWRRLVKDYAKYIVDNEII